MGYLAVQPGDVTMRVTISITDDHIIEGQEEFTVMIMSEGPHIEIEASTSTITIADNDS